MKQTAFLVLIIFFASHFSRAQSITTQPVPTSICAGSSVNVLYSVTGSFVPGNVFTAQLSNDSGSFANPVNIGTLADTTTGDISATIPANTITDTGYRIRVISSNPPVTGTDDGVNITIKNDTPVITIGATETTVCNGSTVTVAATTTNGGPSPVYQWVKNGVDVGANSPNYTDTALNNDDIIFCKLTSDDACANTSHTRSNPITFTVSQTDTPAVTIIANQRDTICAGSSAAFVAVAMYGGSLPSYQWQVNGHNVGTDSMDYTSGALANHDTVSCILTSNAACITQPTAVSNRIIMTVEPVDTPAISITANHTSICSGTPVTFTATASNGGSAPFYEWVVNALNAGGDSATFTTASLTNNAMVTCMFTSSAACANPQIAFSNDITIAVTPSVTPAINISASRNNICSASYDTLTATITNGGGSPVYQWKVNGIDAGTNSAQYIANNFTNNAVVSCVLISDVLCAAPAADTSNDVIMAITPSFTPAVSISATHTDICSSSSATFTAAIVNGGPSPVYEWLRNGILAGGDSVTLTDNNLSAGEVVVCVLISDAACAAPDTVISNTIAITDSAVTPSISISATQTTVCNQSSITFTAVPVNGGSHPVYQWKRNGVNVDTSSATYTDNTLSNGDVITCVLTSDARCLITDTARSNAITITDSAVTPTILIGGTETSICPGTEIVFNAYITNGGSTPSYQWKVNGVNVGRDTSSYKSAALNNNDVVTCELTSSVTCAISDTVTSNALTITVHAIVAPAIVISTTSGPVCAHTSITFNSSITNGGSSPVYLWELNGNYTNAHTVIYTSASLDSADTIRCLLISNALCAQPDSVYSNAIGVTIYPTPNAAITPAGVFTFCQGDSMVFSATAGNTGYLWNDSATTQDITVSTTGAYVVTTTNSYNCTAVSDSVLVTTLPLPTPSISQSVYTLTSTPATSYQWYLADTLLPGDTGQTLELIENGQYQVEVTDSNGCKGISGVFTVFGVGITAVNEDADVKIYPNPNTGSFAVEFSDDAAKEVEVTDVTGRVILTQAGVTKQYTVAMPEGAAGVYLLRVAEHNKYSTFKVVVTQ